MSEVGKSCFNDVRCVLDKFLNSVNGVFDDGTYCFNDVRNSEHGLFKCFQTVLNVGLETTQPKPASFQHSFGNPLLSFATFQNYFFINTHQFGTTITLFPMGCPMGYPMEVPIGHPTGFRDIPGDFPADIPSITPNPIFLYFCLIWGPSVAYLMTPTVG